MIKLYDFELSGNCYKVRLLMDILGVPYERTALDFYPGREHKSPWFLKINPLGQIPVIDDNGFILRDAQAILVYLASSYDSSNQWYPRGNSRILGNIAMWLGFADSLTATASAARLHDSLFYDLDVEKGPRGRSRAVPGVRRTFVVRRAGRAPMDLQQHPADHRRHRLLPLCDAVRGRWYLSPALPLDPPLDRPREAHPRLYDDAGDFRCGCGGALNSGDSAKL